MATSSSLTHAVSEAIDALTGPRWPIVGAVEHVPRRPGLYAIYGDDIAWRELGLSALQEVPLYIGKAEDSLVSRDLNGHFAATPGTAPRTGSSTVRRSFAALLRDRLQLRAVPRNLDKPGHFTHYALDGDGDDRLTRWMHERLALAVWPAPIDLTIRLTDVETGVIHRFTPPINIAKNPGRLPRLSSARSAMAAEAADWRSVD